MSRKPLHLSASRLLREAHRDIRLSPWSALTVLAIAYCWTMLVIGVSEPFGK